MKLMYWFLMSSMIFIPSTFLISQVNSQENELRCSREEVFKFFPTDIVQKVLTENHIPNQKWAAIFLDLQGHDNDIVRDLENRASKMFVNPLTTKGREREAAKLLHSVLFDYFNMVMKSHGIVNEQINKQMMDSIIIRKSELLEACTKSRKL